ncbi:carcinoembryonic antigen-related cell adhesion molecule 1-like [Tachysurus fulvidraco]|uniref:carcinoembryonic antigen-related cell adhesion molecule 1-like n=1 Tax=Tachysurus fulvidraco TaxID=1234273 RepID=UPI001FED8A16|nr:carcinoembryonic antigen-related cell adhesion molecule 1-like [Tachysurus fulvidraco]
MDLHTVCCSLLLLLTCSGRGFGQVLELPESINKTVGENVVITSKRLPEPPHQLVRWKVNASIILSGPPNGITILPPYKDRVSLNTTSLALELRSLTESDTGQYELTVDTPTYCRLVNTSIYPIYTSIGRTSLLVLDSGSEGGHGDSLSAGAIAGIVIGVLLGVAAIAGLIFYFVKVKEMPRTNSRGNNQSEATHNAGGHDSNYENILRFHNPNTGVTVGGSDTQTPHTPHPVTDTFYENMFSSQNKDPVMRHTPHPDEVIYENP